MNDSVSTTLHISGADERKGVLTLPFPRPRIDVHARHIRHATAADTAPVGIREGESVVLLTTTAPRCGRGVLVWCWDEDVDRYRWCGHWVVDGYDWIVTLEGGVLDLRDGKAPCVFEEAAE